MRAERAAVWAVVLLGVGLVLLTVGKALAGSLGQVAELLTAGAAG